MARALLKLAGPRSVDDVMTVSLDGQTYQVAFRWSERADRWTFTLRTAAGDAIVAGVPVLCDRPILGVSYHPGRPPGELIASDPSGSHTAPGRDDMGRRVGLYYVTADAS